MSDLTRVVTIQSPAIHSVSPAVTMFGSSPAAGFPAPGDDLVEAELNVHDLLVKRPVSTFFVRVTGNSMEGAGIFSGDVLAVDRSLDAVPGKIVVAAINGELVVKRVEKIAGQLLLVSEQAGYEPMVIGDGETCYVWGVVVGSVRVF
jgi:DNA polymerase V